MPLITLLCLCYAQHVSGSIMPIITTNSIVVSSWWWA